MGRRELSSLTGMEVGDLRRVDKVSPLMMGEMCDFDGDLEDIRV